MYFYFDITLTRSCRLEILNLTFFLRETQIDRNDHSYIRINVFIKVCKMYFYFDITLTRSCGLEILNLTAFMF